MASELALIAARVLRTSGLPAKRRPWVAPAASTSALAGSQASCATTGSPSEPAISHPV
jgi:hypothetical protein